MALDSGVVNASMSPWLGSSLTVLTGTAVYVCGQAVQRLVLEPIADQRKTIGEIANALLFLGNVGPIPPGAEGNVLLPAEQAEASRSLRQLAARLRASLWTVPAYGLWATLHAVPSRGAVLKASSNMIGWSNSVFSGQPGFHRAAVAKALQIPGDD